MINHPESVAILFTTTPQLLLHINVLPFFHNMLSSLKGLISQFSVPWISRQLKQIPLLPQHTCSTVRGETRAFLYDLRVSD